MVRYTLHIKPDIIHIWADGKRSHIGATISNGIVTTVSTGFRLMGVTIPKDEPLVLIKLFGEYPDDESIIAKIKLKNGTVNIDVQDLDLVKYLKIIKEKGVNVSVLYNNLPLDIVKSAQDLLRFIENLFW